MNCARYQEDTGVLHLQILEVRGHPTYRAAHNRIFRLISLAYLSPLFSYVLGKLIGSEWKKNS